MQDSPRKQALRHMPKFLRDKLNSPDESGKAIVRRHEMDEFARSVGMDEQETWHMFRELKGTVWNGRFLPESLSHERGYTAAQLAWVI